MFGCYNCPKDEEGSSGQIEVLVVMKDILVLTEKVLVVMEEIIVIVEVELSD